MNRLRFALPIIALGVLLLTSWTMPQPAAAQQGGSIDDELLEDLGGDPLKQLDRELFGPDEPQGRAGDPGDDQPGDPNEQLERELGAAATSDEQNPLLGIARQMREVEALIDDRDSGERTQKVQQQIVDDLDKLIEQAKKNCKKCGGGQCNAQASTRSSVKPGKPKQGNRPGKPSSQHVARSNATPGTGTPTRPDMQQMREVMKRLWGELPPKVREQMLQLPVEEFLPKYELLIEAYFRRMAEEAESEGGGEVGSGGE